jgi:hypothetical protein
MPPWLEHWLIAQLRDPVKAVTGAFATLTAIVVGANQLSAARRERKRVKDMESVPPSAGHSPMTASDDTPTQRITIVVEPSSIDDSERRRWTWEIDEARRLYALARDDLEQQKRATLRAQAIADVLHAELLELRRQIEGGHTRLHQGSAGHAEHVEEQDDSKTPPKGLVLR